MFAKRALHLSDEGLVRFSVVQCFAGRYKMQLVLGSKKQYNEIEDVLRQIKNADCHGGE